MYYYIQNIHLEQEKKEANQLAYFLTFFIFWNKIKSGKDKEFQEFLKEKMNEVSIKFNQYDKIDKLLELFGNLADSLELTNLSSFWENTTLELLADYKMKFLSETMIYYLNYKDNDTELLSSFLERNKKIISIINTKDTDIKILFILFHSCLKKCCKTDYFYSSFNTSLGSTSNKEDNLNKSTQKDDSQNKSLIDDDNSNTSTKTRTKNNSISEKEDNKEIHERDNRNSVTNQEKEEEYHKLINLCYSFLSETSLQITDFQQIFLKDYIKSINPANNTDELLKIIKQLSMFMHVEESLQNIFIEFLFHIRDHDD
jgi:hypothetical protein